MKGGRILVFCQTKRGTDSLTSQLNRSGFPAISLHGNKTQRERERVLREFKFGRTSVMVATDVAGRGLDVPEIRIVVNYDFPGTCEDYIHRIGRTGRAGKHGTAYSFFTSDDGRLARELVAILREASQDVSPQLLELTYSSRGGRGGSHRGGRGGSYGGHGGYGRFRNNSSSFGGSGSGSSSYGPPPPWGGSGGSDSSHSYSGSSSSYGNGGSSYNAGGPPAASMPTYGPPRPSSGYSSYAEPYRPAYP
eukprot:TRINITY_DN1120_c0_g1_i3.p1 TRINITY_DN1120_c0_g1~~TRINITY_DN1120_c0_g1_i3.p1  ORF type:complete len:277 (+),score=9.09 TRINITY_DN1120_c0_g1_i3:87-833(+)